MLNTKIKACDLNGYVEISILEALQKCASRKDYSKLMSMNAIDTIVPKVTDDLLSFIEKDPAAQSDPLLILDTYTSFSAVLHYRISHWVHQAKETDRRIYLDDALPAMIFKRGKRMSGAEIHFRSKIGERFILDHGFGTVIGETSIIGDDCYFLGGVTLGARGISANPCCARHPIIGNRVQIGAFTAVLGRIRIGDDVFIGPNCIVTEDILDGAKVTAKPFIQIALPQTMGKNKSGKTKNT